MSVSTQRGHIAFAHQGAKVGDSAFTPANYTWYRHRALTADVGVAEMNDALPPEVGGSLYISSTYSNGAFVAGGMSVAARLAGSLGYLLFSALGKKTVTASSGAQSQITRFSTDSSDEQKLGWLALRKYTPGPNGSDGLTEYLYDCRATAMTLNMSPMGPMTAEFGFVGRKPYSVDNEPLAGVLGAFEDGTSLGMSKNGLIQIPGLDITSNTDGAFTAAQIIISNGVSQPQQEMIIGSSHPDDFVALTRSVAIRLVYKWKDPTLYKLLYYNGSAGNWSPQIKTSSVLIRSQSDNLVPGFSNPYKMEFNAPNVDWEMGVPRLLPGNVLQVEMTGLVKGTVSALPTAYIDLHNSENYSALV